MDTGSQDIFEAKVFEPVEAIDGRLDAGVLLVCDHARNALPAEYGALGLPGADLDRHIAYDIGARWLTLQMARALQAPAVLSTFSRLLIDPNRGADDPTLVMRFSDGAIVPGNARADAAEIERRTRLFWRPYRDAVQGTAAAMLATGRPPALLSIHSFTDDWRGFKRPWKVGVLYDSDDRLARAFLAGLAAEGLAPQEIGDNEPYAGGLKGDTIDEVATARGLANALIEVRQDLIATEAAAQRWGERLARVAERALGAGRPALAGARRFANAGPFRQNRLNATPRARNPMETPLTPLAFAARARRIYGKRDATVFEGVTRSYAEFLDRTDRWSHRLQALGVGPGDRVAYIAQNIPAHLEGYYAVPQIGAVLVPINYRLAASDFVYILNHCGARTLCVDADYVEAIAAIRAELPLIEHFVALEGAREGWLDYEAEVAASAPDFAPVEIDESDLITINYTSGTTARPKGVMITHRNAYLNVLGTLVHFHVTPADRYLWTLPMFHANGWTFVWLATARGAAHVCLRKVDPAAIFRLVGEQGVTTLCAAPTVLIGVANAPPAARAPAAGRKVRLLTAGAPPAAHTIERIERELGWEVLHVYGMTETSPLILACEPLPEHEALGAAERAGVKARQGVELVSSGEIRVIDENGDAVPGDGRTLGEICVRGNVVMKGYFNDPAATEAAFKGGWMHTGDAAVVHPDGYVEIKDRFKDVIISGGENISSVEIEGVLLTHPSVQEVSVVGLKHERWGEAPHAFVVLKPGESATEEELRQFARAHLARFKVPQGVSFVPELPKTATGKIQKFVLRGRAPAIVAQ